ncbi:MAG: GIY-YIG nuclease family protein [Fuerstiella sp.]
MEHTSRPFSIRIFLPDGSTDGLRIVEKSNWSGRGVVCPRAVFRESKSRDEFNSTGVYVLLGPAESGSLPVVYIGQGDPVRPRMESHYGKKDFWQQAVFFVSKDDHLNKASISHLEARLIRLAQDAKRCTLDNSNTPVLPSLSEMDEADAERFLDEILMCLPIVGVNVFRTPESHSRPDRQMLELSGSGAKATGYEAADGLVVLAGSMSRVTGANTCPDSITALRETLLQSGVFERDGDSYRLAQDYTFSSPSQAAAVMMARSANGRIEWSGPDGRTLKEIQEAGVNDE